MHHDDLTVLSATELAARIRRGELTASEVVDAHLARIERREPAIHAWTIIDAEGARERADALDRGPIVGPLHGLPIGVKDIIDVAGLPTECGSPIYRGHRAREDGACVAAARGAGAIPLGKTVTTEFATFAPAATVNPRNFSHTPGGSSSGSAAAVADSMVPLAFGTQTQGSIIRPASFCGIVGYKPSFGIVARAGVKLGAESLDTVGVLARTVPDAALLIGAIGGRPDLLSPPPLASPLRIGLCRTYEWPETAAEVHAAMYTAERVLSAAGAKLSCVELPQQYSALREANADIFGYELARNLTPERSAHAAQLTPRLREMIDAGERISAERHERALAAARACRAAFPAAMGECDVLLTPSAAGEAPAGLESTGSPVMSRLWTLLHVPCVNVPATRGPNGLPVGLQVVGRFGDDALVLAAAAWIEARLRPSWRDRAGDPSS